MAVEEIEEHRGEHLVGAVVKGQVDHAWGFFELLSKPFDFFGSATVIRLGPCRSSQHGDQDPDGS